MTRRTALPLFLLALGVYGYFYQAGGWNQNSRFDLVRAIVEDGAIRIDRLHANTGDKARVGAHYYSDKAPGLSWLAVPFYAVSHAARGGEPPDAAQLARSAWAATVGSVALPAALAVVALAHALGSLGLGPPARVGIALAYGFGTLALPYATLFYGHQLAAALGAIAFAWLIHARVRWRDAGEPVASWALFAIGMLLGAAVAVEYPSAVTSAALGVFALATLGAGRRIGWLVLGGALSGVPLAVYHALAFGSPFATPYAFSTQPHRESGVFMGIVAPNPEALWHLTFGSFRGLFHSAPWLLAALPGAFWLARDRRTRAEAWVCIVVALVFLWLNVSLVDWEGGWTLGARYLVPALPFVALATAGVAFALRRAKPRARRLVAGGLALAALYSAFLMFAGTAVRPEVPWRYRKPFAVLVPAFLRGGLSLNTESIDDARYPRGPRQAWNLGEALGLSGLPTLLPLGVWAAACAAGLAAGVRREENDAQSTI